MSCFIVALCSEIYCSAAFSTRSKIALSKMKNNKAPGSDDIPSELVSALEEVGIKEVTKLLNNIYDTEEIPTVMKKSIYNAIPKKGGYS